MDPRPLNFIAEATGGEIRCGAGDTLVSGVCTDSRQVQRGDLFIALAGEQFDGHKFIAEVAAKGVAAVMVERGRVGDVQLSSPPLIAVANTRTAYAQLAGRYRQDFDLPVIAVGGSNGKTTTKDLVAAVLRERGPALWSQASFNNDIGVPHTLLRLERQHTGAVLEVGTNHPGELAPLVKLIQPRFGIITSIGREHLEFFGDVNGVVQEEGWLAELLPSDGVLFVNGDCAEMELIVRRTRARVVRVGFGPQNDWRASEVRYDAHGQTFQVASPSAASSGAYRIGLLGRHQVLNALLAGAVGTEVGLTSEQVRRALAGCTPPKMRLQLWEAHGVRVLDDAYNANADSMLAALQTLHDLPCTGRRVAVLGDMAELGVHSVAAHVEVGRRAAELGVNRLFAVGKMAGHLAGAARAAGLSAVTEIAEVAGAGAAVRNELLPGDVVLLKASRSARFERVADVLRGHAGPSAKPNAATEACGSNPQMN
ncbi:MAG: UDP-N-acetylmuramoylalanyl-D-glutamate--2,6-diaminopimelate ligase [Pedosphaera sp. Tous-C6FEB]|nr:MAG: UDP-N-acetylmuramoylalanyl-D-glutamate--2,6-diaminopimelate ligase [Pedosphaera sp. Tous-C6FEB]